MRTKPNDKGASALETSIALAVIGILIAAASFSLSRTVSSARDTSSLNQLEAVKKAIIGEPRALPPGEKSGIRYGYIGDMGRLPSALSQLENIGAQPDYTVDALSQLGAGWRGPYISSSISSGMIDPWGKGLTYGIASGTSTITGATLMATIRSSGADQVASTADDHVVEIYKSETYSRVIGYVKDNAAGTLPGVTVNISYPSSGVGVTASAATDSEGLYIFDNVPYGSQVIQVSPKLTYRAGTGFTTGAARNNVEFVVENLARLATTVSTIRLTWTTDPAADFKELWVAGTKYFDGVSASGATLPFTAQTVSGTGVIQQPYRIDVTGLVLQVPDIVVGSVGIGGALTFEIRDFEDVATTNNLDMTGVTFTAEFSDGSVTQFSPARK